MRGRELAASLGLLGACLPWALAVAWGPVRALLQRRACMVGLVLCALLLGAALHLPVQTQAAGAVGALAGLFVGLRTLGAFPCWKRASRFHWRPMRRDEEA